MADPQQSQQQQQQQPIDLSAGLVPAQGSSTGNPASADSIDLSAGLVPVDARKALTRPDLVAPPGVPSPANQPMQKTWTGKVTDKFADAGNAIEQAGQLGGLVVPMAPGVPSGVNAGLLKGAAQTAHTVATFGTEDTPEALKAHGVQENVGAGAEGTLEFIMGDEALKGLSLAEKLAEAAKVTRLLEKPGLTGKIMKIGLNAARTGAIGTAQGLLHGQSVGESAASGAAAGGTGAALEAGAEGIKALAPIVKDIAGESIPVRASQDSGVAKAAENAAPTKTLEKFDVEQTQPAAKRAIGNIASEVKNTAAEQLPARDAEAAIQKLRNATKTADTLGDAAQSIREQSKPVFEKLDALTKDQGTTFSDLQQAERGAFRSGNIQAAKEARAAQENILDKYKDQFNPDDLQAARTNWRQASALADIHDSLNTKSVVGPTPVKLRPVGSPDPGVINGKNFSKEILRLANDGSLQQAGLTPGHVQALQDLGTLLEKSAVEKPDLLNKAFKAGKILVGGPATGGSGYLASLGLGKIMTDPVAAAKVLKAAQAAAKIAPATAAQGARGILDGAQGVLGGSQ